jgi:hypothetical protein
MMNHAEQLRSDLAFVDRMIAECQEHIVRLKKTTAEMSHDGQDTNLARDVLASFVAALTRHEAQRRLVASLIERAREDEAAEQPSSPPALSMSPQKAARRALPARAARRRRKA